jgi:hypothetical protein
MQMRCLIYLCSAAAEDEEVQKTGVVFVCRVGPRCTRILLDDPSAVKIPLLLGVFPFRVDAIHVSSYKSSMPAIFARHFAKIYSALSRQSVLGRRIGVRSRYYTGTCSMVLES